MVSKASEDLPDPARPVMTTSRSRGRSTSIFFRLWTRAPRTAIQSWAIPTAWNFWKNPTSDFSTPTPPPTGAHGAPSVAVQEIKHQADDQPGPEPFPRLVRKTDHDEQAGRRREQGHNPDERHAERTGP